jgi:AAA15 family ATPase/GTPase
MYIDHIEIENFRTFRKTRIDFCHADKEYGDKLPRPKLPNVNLLLANNGFGKTTLLRAIVPPPTERPN